MSTKKLTPLSIFGTTSDAGKTTLVMALCRIFAQYGYSVAPFKAQNVSNNAGVTPDGKEISRAQCLQAEAANILPHTDMNPVLLKSQGNAQIQVILNGDVWHSNDVWQYYRQDLDILKTAVKSAFERLSMRYDLVVVEGAGSPVELNLMDKDLSNIYVAETFQTKIILVADIERGGVFASIYGTLALLPEALRDNVIGVIVNKFRGDMAFFDAGRDIIEQQFHVPVLGVVPYQRLNVDMEDQQSLSNYEQRLHQPKIHLGVLIYPHLSNYNDLDPLMADPEIRVTLVESCVDLSVFDALLLMGSKTTIQDLAWLKKIGLFAQVQQFKRAIFGLCGGYQMLFEQLHDPDNIENKETNKATGLGFIDDNIVFKSPKRLHQGQYTIFGQTVTGYEMHNGHSEKYPLFYQQGLIAGTHVHGVFDNNSFRAAYFQSIHADYQGYDYSRYRTAQIQNFVDLVEKQVDCEQIMSALLNASVQ